MAEDIKVSLNKSNLALQKDKSVILIVQVTGTDEKVDVTWTSSDSTKVTVTVDASDSKKATVKRLSTGETSVIASVKVGEGTKKFSCRIIDEIIPLTNGKYGLIIHQITQKIGDVEYSVTDKEFIQGKIETFTLTNKEQTKTIDCKDWMLNDVSFHKEVYCPGYMEIVIQTTDELSMFQGLVSLAYYSSETEIVNDDYVTTYTQAYMIAKSYYIFEKKKKGKYVTLKAYSVDKFLTKCKANRAFTRKTLSDMLSLTLTSSVVGEDKDSIANFVTNVNKTDGTNPDITCNLHHLIKDEKDKKECLIPHAVQYEESFYDFLVRLCNRNGEFLYCEDNQLHLGAALSNSFGITESEGSIDIEYNDYDTTGNPGFNEIIYPSTYFEPIHCFDEDKYKLDQDSEYTYAKWSDFMPPAPTAISWAKSILEAKGILVGLEALAMKVVLQSSISSQVWHKINGNYRDKYFKKSDDAGSGYLNERFLFCDKDSPLQGDFYKNIFCYGEEARAKQVLVTCTTCLEPKLGDKIIIGGAEYVVYQVKGGVKAITAELSGYKEYYELLLLPFIATKTATKTATETATETVIKLYPLPMSEKWIRRASTQRAEVINNFDPKKLGRVQVKYKYNDWKGNTDTTPWINVTYPKASDGQGFMFMPDIGDVVLIDYEDGNVERPFMVGAFYDDGREPAASASMYQVGQTKSITSANGHHISFTDTPGGGAKFMAELIPIWSLVSKFGEGTKWGDSDKLNDSKYFSGGFEIGDELGIYSITGSTHEREISIKSPLGEVNINAFTGITINAPLGDVKIVGKNVEIEAKNNLTLTSGSRIPNDYYKVKDGWRELGTFVGGMIGMTGFDLSYYRTWLEAFFKPIGGTMLIKSHRYMQLEAGEGRTNIVRTRKNFKDGKRNALKKVFGRSAFDDKEELEVYKTTISGAISKVVAFYKNYNKFVVNHREFINANGGYNDFRTAADKIQGLDEQYKIISGCLNITNTNGNYSLSYKDSFNNLINSSSNQYDGLKKAVGDISSKIKGLFEEIDKLNTTDNKNLFTDGNVKTAIFDSLNNCKTAIQDGTTTIIAIAKRESSEAKTVVIEMLKNLKLVDTPQSVVKFTDKIALDEGKVNELNIFKFNESIKPQIKDDLVMPSLPSMGGKILKVLSPSALKALGGDGFYDDAAWGKNEKGGIYMSAHRGKSYYMHEDGTLKLGTQVNIDNVVLAEFVREKVRNLSID